MKKWRGMGPETHFFCTKFFDNPSGHGRPRRKSWTSAPKSAFSCGPGGGEKLFDPRASGRKGQECPREFRTKKFMFMLFFLPWREDFLEQPFGRYCAASWFLGLAETGSADLCSCCSTGATQIYEREKGQKVRRLEIRSSSSKLNQRKCGLPTFMEGVCKLVRESSCKW